MAAQETIQPRYLGSVRSSDYERALSLPIEELQTVGLLDDADFMDMPPLTKGHAPLDLWAAIRRGLDIDQQSLVGFSWMNQLSLKRATMSRTEQAESDYRALQRDILYTMGVFNLCPAFHAYMSTTVASVVDEERGIVYDNFLLDTDAVFKERANIARVHFVQASELLQKLQGELRANEAELTSVIFQAAYALQCLDEVGVSLNTRTFELHLLEFTRPQLLRFHVATGRALTLKTLYVLKFVDFGSFQKRAVPQLSESVLSSGAAALRGTDFERFAKALNIPQRQRFSLKKLLQSAVEDYPAVLGEDLSGAALDAEYTLPQLAQLLEATTETAAAAATELRDATTEITQLVDIQRAIAQMQANNTLSLCEFKAEGGKLRVLPSNSASDSVQVLGDLSIVLRDGDNNSRLVQRGNGKQPFFGKLFLRPHSVLGEEADNSLLVESLAYSAVSAPLYMQRATPCLVKYYGTLYCSDAESALFQGELGKRLHKLTRQQLEDLAFEDVQVGEWFDARDSGAFAILLEQMSNGAVTVADYLFNAQPDDASYKAGEAALVAIMYTIACFERAGFMHNDMHAGNVFMVPNEADDKRVALRFGRSEFLLLELPVIPKVFDFDRSVKVATPYSPLRWTNNYQRAKKGVNCIDFGQCDKVRAEIDVFRLLFTCLATLRQRAKDKASQQWTARFEALFRALLNDPAGKSLDLKYKYSSKHPQRKYMVMPGILCMLQGERAKAPRCKLTRLSAVTGKPFDLLSVLRRAPELAKFRVKRVPAGVPKYTLPGI